MRQSTRQPSSITGDALAAASRRKLRDTRRRRSIGRMADDFGELVAGDSRKFCGTAYIGCAGC